MLRWANFQTRDSWRVYLIVDGWWYHAEINYYGPESCYFYGVYMGLDHLIRGREFSLQAAQQRCESLFNGVPNHGR